MRTSSIFKLAAVFAVIGLTAGCANTIRGVGADTANTVNAAQGAGNNVARAADN